MPTFSIRVQHWPRRSENFNMVYTSIFSTTLVSSSRTKFKAQGYKNNKIKHRALINAMY